MLNYQSSEYSRLPFTVVPKIVYIIYHINQMVSHSIKNMLFISVLLLISISYCQKCKQGQIYTAQKCISCKNVINSKIIDNDLDSLSDRCSCAQGFKWSSSLTQCIRTSPLLSARFQDLEEDQMVENIVSVSRNLQSLTCNLAGGFLPYQHTFLTSANPSVCLNCRLLPYGLGSKNSTTCTCSSSFKYLTDFQTCYCYTQRSFIDPYSNTCTPCATVTSGFSACMNCTPPYQLSILGCVYAPNTANGANTATGCQTGYIFNYWLAKCICNIGLYYAIGSNGVCSLCATTDTNCRSCINTYVRDGYVCKHGSLIPNYDIATFACKTGRVFKVDLFTNQKVSCACNFAGGSYTNAGACATCSTLPAGVTLASCQTCANAAGFHKGYLECIYCPGVANSLLTATINGCDCKVNYFWNATSSQCECDFVLGLIAGANGVCLSCATIPNTGSDVFPNVCSCLKGYVWSPITKTCVCDTTFPSVFSVAGKCYDCAIIQGSDSTVGTNGISCNCITGYYWNPALNQCVCDFNQNFVPRSNGFCTDCSLAPFSNGLATAFGCVCINGLSWNAVTGQCVCPAGNVMSGQKCVSCATTTLPSGAVVNDCNTCNSAKGFLSLNNQCYQCNTQIGASGVITSGACACTDATRVWKPSLGTCVCNWGANYVTMISGTSFTCSLCPYVYSGTTTCACGLSFILLDSVNNICTDASTSPSGTTSSTGVFSCNAGYKWSQMSYPYKCNVGNSIFKGYDSSSTNTSIACSSATNPTACGLCDVASGFLMVLGTNQCLLCSTVTGAIGTAVWNKCLCNSGSFNSVSLTCDATICATGTIYNPTAKTCLCDPVRSILVGGVCTSCGSINLSNGYAATLTTCGCNSPNFWVASATGGLCTNTTCTTTTQLILANGSCFTCPTLNGAGITIGSICKCNANYIWNATTLTCVCDLSKSYLIGTTCLACPSSTVDTNSANAGDGLGKCLCTANYVWTTTATSGVCSLCNVVANTIYLTSGSCMVCGATGTYTTTKVVNTLNNTCNCATSLVWNAAGYCDCGTTSALIITGNTYTCFSCSNALAYTSTKKDQYSCNCVSANLQWNTTSSSCGCSSASSVIVGSGATTSCFSCPQSGNILGISADRKSCICVGKLSWIASSKTCGCLNSSQIIVGSGVSAQCVACANIQYATATATGTCGCLGTGLIFSSAGNGSCSCPASNIILPSFTCFTCPTGTTPMTPYECLCPTGSIWIYSSNSCATCGSATIPNSQATGPTNIACVCNANYIWDVMTQTCILSNSCTTATATCMRCPTGTASALVTTTARNLFLGSTIQAQLNGTFTNYNQIKAFQCTCATGYAWDSFRLRCFLNTLQ